MRPLLFALFLTAAMPAIAQEDLPAPVKFGDAEITFARGEDEEITVSHNGVELYRNFYVAFSQVANIEGQDVAILSGGDGGNACGPNALIVTLPEDSPDAKLEVIGECGSPEPAVTSNEIHFVPFVRPGASLPLMSWTPSRGLVTAGLLSFEPQEGSNWVNLDVETVKGPWDIFDNADVYAAGKALLGERFADVMQGLAVAGRPTYTDDNFLSGAGCAPHSCGSVNGFFGIDIANRQVFAALRTIGEKDEFWPQDFNSWPAQLQKAFEDSKIAP